MTTWPGHGPHNRRATLTASVDYWHREDGEWLVHCRRGGCETTATTYESLGEVHAFADAYLAQGGSLTAGIAAARQARTPVNYSPLAHGGQWEGLS